MIHYNCAGNPPEYLDRVIIIRIGESVISLRSGLQSMGSGGGGDLGVQVGQAAARLRVVRNN